MISAALYSLRMIGERVQQQVAAPGMRGDEGAIHWSASSTESDVGGLHGHVVGTASRGRRQAALLVGGDAIGAGELVDDGLQIVPREPGAAVQQEQRFPVTRDRTAQPAAGDGHLERNAHARTTQRKPMWLMPVSIICGRRAAGR